MLDIFGKLQVILNFIKKNASWQDALSAVGDILKDISMMFPNLPPAPMPVPKGFPGVGGVSLESRIEALVNQFAAAGEGGHKELALNINWQLLIDDLTKLVKDIFAGLWN